MKSRILNPAKAWGKIAWGKTTGGEILFTSFYSRFHYQVKSTERATRNKIIWFPRPDLLPYIPPPLIELPCLTMTPRSKKFGSFNGPRLPKISIKPCQKTAPVPAHRWRETIRRWWVSLHLLVYRVRWFPQLPCTLPHPDIWYAWEREAARPCDCAGQRLAVRVEGGKSVGGVYIYFTGHV